MMEWWAYLADILTFYNERIANQDYLRTADLPVSVQRLIRVLGYRPRPGIGATGSLAALMSGPKSLQLQQGFQIQSKPGPGRQPQVFELNADTLIQQPDAIPVGPVPRPSLLGSDGKSVLLQGTVTSITVGDELLLLHEGWVGIDGSGHSDLNYALVVVQNVAQEKDPRGNTNTRVIFTQAPNLPNPEAAEASGYRLLKSAQSTHVWQYKAVIFPPLAENEDGTTTVHLESITRQIKTGDPVMFEIPASGMPGEAPPSPTLVSVTSYTEQVWYANPDPPFDPRKAPNPPTPPIPIPHSVVSFVPPLAEGWTAATAPGRQPADLSALIRYAWQDVGTLIPTPATTLSGASPTVVAVPPATFPHVSNLPLLIEDTNGNGEAALGTAMAGQSRLQLSGLPSPPVTLTPPLDVLFDLLSVSRGKTVANEALGSGDATVAGQEFVLQNSPLTYLLSGESASGSDYKSTLRVFVNGVEWKEVPSFYAQPPGAHIFVTREDEQNQTHVQFGDGVNGARLPSGVNNVLATYRYGSGAEAPNAGSLTVILRPQPGLKAIRNPVPVRGGADPDSPQRIKKYAPQSVLTFGRAVSGADYETIAAQAPGVARAKAYWAWDPVQQRTLVRIYVGDDANAVNAARTALAGAADPNRPVAIRQATVVAILLRLTLVIDPRYVAADVATAATAALIDPDTGLFGANVIGIGQLIYESQVYQACLGVPGVMAVHSLQFSTGQGAPILNVSGPTLFAGLIRRPPIFVSAPFQFEPPFRLDPGEGGVFRLPATSLTISTEVAANAG
jgi:hypothetical protein